MISCPLRAVLLSSALFVGPALADDGEHHEAEAPRRTELFAPGVIHASGNVTASKGAPMLITGLGNYGMRITTAEPLAQTWFD